MFEKVNPQHPDKVADRIAGAIVDLCYTKSEWPKVAAEVLLGHGQCSLQIETSERLTAEELEAIVHRIAGEEVEVRALIVPQDVHLADNQAAAALMAAGVATTLQGNWRSDSPLNIEH